MTHLHFTFGPVQGFVAQARRTRDLYAGSFLLSHLAITAMRAAGGKVILPNLETLLAFTGDHAVAPNRFIAEFADAADAAQAGERACKALLDEWEKIADTVWDRFVGSVARNGLDTHKIWERQIRGFWEIAWCVGPKEETDLLDRRKNWRTPPRTEEGGDHCTLMGQWQELSGFILSKQRQEQNAFWKAIRSQSAIKDLDLEEDERLCAIAMVKRFFPHVSKEAIGRELDMKNWPSTVSMAALPWQLGIKKKADPQVLEKATEYAESVKNEDGATVNVRQIPSLANFANAGRFNELSGNFLNRTALENKRGTPLKNEDSRKRYLDDLRKLEKVSGDHAGNHYALLLMDGDHMGKLIRDNTPQTVSDALTHYCKKVPELVEKHDGITIYAGGDDLLAMLPLDQALPVVNKVRDLYAQSFDNIEATISAGLVFAHYRNAFSLVLEYAHELLHKHAKDDADRDAIAIGVLKGSGQSCRWVGKFKHFQEGDNHCFEPLIVSYNRSANREGNGISSSFLYNLRERFQEIFGTDQNAALEGFGEEQIIRLFVAEYLHGRLSKKPAEAEKQREDATLLMKQLYHVCQQSNAAAPNGLKLCLDGLRLIKFLALDGKEGAE